MLPRALLAFACCLFILGHMTGSLRGLVNMFDFDFALGDMPYLLSLPGMCLFTFFMLRN